MSFLITYIASCSAGRCFLKVAEPAASGICRSVTTFPTPRTVWGNHPPPALGGMVTTFKIAVLGAQGVGKSAIVRQFMYNEFSETSVPTNTRRVFLPAVVMNGHVHELQIMDFPPISSFPVNTLQVSLEYVGWKCWSITQNLLVQEIYIFHNTKNYRETSYILQKNKAVNLACI